MLIRFSCHSLCLSHVLVNLDSSDISSFLYTYYIVFSCPITFAFIVIKNTVVSQEQVDQKIKMTASTGDTSSKSALLLLFIVSIGNALRCEYADTFNITGGVQNPDGSITFNGMSFASDQYERFNHVLLDDTTKQMVEPHIRACLENTNLPCKYIDSIDIENGTTNADQSITYEHTTFSKDRYATFDYALSKNEDGTLVRQAIKPHTRGCLANTLPCDYFESVDISAGTLAADGTVRLEHMTFPPDEYSIISYEIKNGNTRISVAPHRRGCVCNRQSCIRLCCKIGQLFVAGAGCVEHKAAAASNISMKIRTKEDQLIRAHLSDHFAYVTGKSCPIYYGLNMTEPYELNHVS